MKKYTRKLLALLLTLVMCLSLFAGCGNESTVESTPSTSGSDVSIQATTPAATEEAAPLTNADIYPLDSDTVFTVACGKVDPNEMDATKRWAEVTGVEIDWITWEDAQVKMALTSKDDVPDAIFYMGAGALDKATVYEYGTAGVFVNFMDYLDIMPNFKALLDSDPGLLAFAQNADGSIYSLPRVGKTSTDYGNLLYFRTDMMKEIGWENPPATTDEFLQYITELQAHYGADDPEFQAFNAYNSKYMGWDYSSGVLPFFFPSFGELSYAGLTTADGKTVQLGLATEQYKHTLEFMNQVYESGAFGQDIYTEDGTVSRALTSDNKVAITPFASYLTKDNFASGELDLTILEPLTSEYNSEKVYRASSPYLWRVCVLSTQCEDIETMVRWYDSFYATEENPLNEEGTIWGISSWIGELGVDYTVDKEKNTYTVLPHEGYETASAWFSNESFGSALGQMDFLYIDESGTGLQMKAEGTVENLLPYAANDFDMSLLILTEEETDIYNDVWTDINTYVTEMTAQFITGEKDIAAEWDTYMKNLEAMGLQDLLDVYQAAYDRYLNQ